MIVHVDKPLFFNVDNGLGYSTKCVQTRFLVSAKNEQLRKLGQTVDKSIVAIFLSTGLFCIIYDSMTH